ncbi:hypothetical protein [Flavicella sediminum]|uniref:hypothetical protein n=1 Tax=Flavicella sediminum TaxID=2585141 RepID=UPI001121E6CB|nr:hypothetical protein [Flavicella sediminum]
MELQEIKTLVENFEDKIIHNFETHFSYLVLEDFYDGGYEDQIEDSFYYEEYFSRYSNDIINLLLETEDNMTSEFMEIKIRLIKLKRIIDTRLSKIKTNNNNPSRTKTRNTQFIFNSNINKENIINLIYTLLLNNKLINEDEDTFKSHFETNWDSKIRWLGTEIQLTHLITLLIENNILDNETQNFKYKVISSHFINKKENPYKEKQLSSVLADKRVMIPNDDITFKIIQEISTHL